MENIRQAVERARRRQNDPKHQFLDNLGEPHRRIDASAGFASGLGLQTPEMEIDSAYLLSRRIVSHNGADYRSRPYDMLRTQVLQTMDSKGWKVLGVTSPTPACGKTLTALNLALSISRQPDRSVVLVDLDLQKPQVGVSLGLTLTGRGVLDLLEERTGLQSAAIPVRLGNQGVVIFPTAATRESSELMGSRAMQNLLLDIKKNYHSQMIIVDLPPVLPSDDVIAVLPQLDCVLLVAAVGVSKASEIEECKRHLQSSHLVRLVLNKVPVTSSSYYNDY